MRNNYDSLIITTTSGISPFKTGAIWTENEAYTLVSNLLNPEMWVITFLVGRTRQCIDALTFYRLADKKVSLSDMREHWRKYGQQ